MSDIKYTLQIPVGSGKTAWDLFEKGEITPTQFGVYIVFHRYSTWGYAGKVIKKSWTEWSEVFRMSRKWAMDCAKRLTEVGLLYKYPSKRGVTNQFLIFKEALTPDEIDHYLKIFEDNPKFRYVKHKCHDVEDTIVAVADIIEPKSFDYDSEWWKQRSQAYRKQQAWTCERCRISLTDDRKFLHTHHIRGTQHNEPKDLIALCIGCHSEQGETHGVLKHEANYRAFMQKYGERWKILKK